MKCSRCKRLIVGDEIRYPTEGDFMGKPLCKRCKSEVEEISRTKYRSGLAERHNVGDTYGLDIYGRRPDGN